MIVFSESFHLKIGPSFLTAVSRRLLLVCVCVCAGGENAVKSERFFSFKTNKKQKNNNNGDCAEGSEGW